MSPAPEEMSSQDCALLAHGISMLLESANKENSSETELREAVRRISQAWDEGVIALVQPVCVRALRHGLREATIP